MKTLGVCLGASSVSFVKVESENGTIRILDAKTIAHNGNPKGVFLDNLKVIDKEHLPVVVTGRKFRELVKLPTISEPEATEEALQFINRDGKKYSAIASVGGETFIVYTLDDENRINNVITGNKCASGTGEFFMQQIKRMNLDITDAVKVARGVKPFKVSGRCSVFCKSDCTHALNKGTDIGEVASGLSQMIAEKIVELLRKAKQERVLVVGGTSQNDVVMEFLRAQVPTIEIPKESTYFEALGAAIHGVKNEIDRVESFDDIFIHRDSSFDFLEPLSRYEHNVTFKHMDRGNAKDGDRCIVGLDVGSTTTKAVLLRTDDDKILASIYLRTNGNPIQASRECYAELLKQVPQKVNIVGLGTTGSGRHIAGLHAMTAGIINEIVAHATAATHFDQDVDTIFEIGGQDAKYTFIVNKVPADYAMNEACSAGTGSFLEESAYESLRIDVKDIAEIAMKGKRPPNFNDQCAAFISSDIKTAFQEDISREDVVAGLVYSICLNYVNRVKGTRQVGKRIFMQGGVCYNKAVPIAMAALTGSHIIVPPDPGLMGAYGVALEVKEKISLGFIEEKPFDLAELASREVTYKKSFICMGGREKCDRKCSVNMIEVMGKTFPFGGACNKYYNQLLKVEYDNEKYDYVKKREYLTFVKFAETTPETAATAKTIGINGSFHTNTLYPLYHMFFTKLGFNVVRSTEVKDAGVERELTSFCFPSQLSLGLFQDLVDKKPDFIFLPNVVEMYVNKAEHHRVDYNATCIFVQGEPYFLKQSYKNDYDFAKVVSPTLNFAYGYETQEKQFVDTAKELGVTDAEKAKAAYHAAVANQKAYMAEMNRTAEHFIVELEKNPQDFGVVLFGRPYNAFIDIAHKGIPQKFASRGIYVIPYDMFDYHEEHVDEDMYFEVGKKILKGAQIVKRHPQLFGTFITNFSCAPDSFIVNYFRDIMGTKPSLTLELDGHTADAGVNTRIEAALDIIRNYRKISYKIKDTDYSEFTPAKIEMHNNAAVYVTSDGEKVPLTDDRVVVIVPSMGDLAAMFFAAGLRNLGIHAVAMPEGNPEILKQGRANATGKECLPYLLCLGSLLEYIDKQWDGKKYLAFFVNKASGNCRVGQYHVAMRDVVRRRRMKNVTTLSLANDDGYAGMGAAFAIRSWQAITASDVLDDIRSGIMAHAHDPILGMKVFNEELKKIVVDFEKGNPYPALRSFVSRIKKEVPARVAIKDAKYVAMCGEIYVRRDGFSHKWLNRRLAAKGFIVKDAYIGEWILYLEYLLKNKLLEPTFSIWDRIEMFVRNVYMRYTERKIKKLLAKTGYYEFSWTKIDPLIDHSAHIVPNQIKGEPGLTLGVGMHETVEKYCGVINIGPFGCMPVRFTESIMMPEMKIENKKATKRIHDKGYDLPAAFTDSMSIPFLTIESDGNVYPQVIEARLETFAMQADRMARIMHEEREKGTITRH
ncbi:MAG: activase [Spirochaetes bacterium]|nr:activase [Spirochaetota bacterium]